MAERLTDALRPQEPHAPRTRSTVRLGHGHQGIRIRITARGAKAFVLDYRAKGRQRRITIGSYPDWTVCRSREEAKAMKRAVDRGADPMAERHCEAAAPNMRDLWERYRSDHLPSKAARTQADERSMWEKLILPVLGTTTSGRGHPRRS